MELTNLEKKAQILGFPATLFGLTPNDTAYWREPGLPWLTSEQRHPDRMPLDYRGNQMLLSVAYLNGDQMAPRFPNGCGVQTAPVYERQQLVVGRVYIYRYWDDAAQEWAYEMGRLVRVGGNHLEVRADNRPGPRLWLLEDKEQQATWNVSEVTHYVSLPRP